VKNLKLLKQFYVIVLRRRFSDELGYLVDAIVNEDKIGSFDKRPNDLSLEVSEAADPVFCHVLPTIFSAVSGSQGGQMFLRKNRPTTTTNRPGV
jgi:hypothetical protein